MCFHVFGFFTKNKQREKNSTAVAELSLACLETAAAWIAKGLQLFVQLAYSCGHCTCIALECIIIPGCHVFTFTFPVV